MTVNRGRGIELRRLEQEQARLRRQQRALRRQLADTKLDEKLRRMAVRAGVKDVAAAVVRLKDHVDKMSEDEVASFDEAAVRRFLFAERSVETMIDLLEKKP